MTCLLTDNSTMYKIKWFRHLAQSTSRISNATKHIGCFDEASKGVAVTKHEAVIDPIVRLYLLELFNLNVISSNSLCTLLSSKWEPATSVFVKSNKREKNSELVRHQTRRQPATSVFVKSNEREKNSELVRHRNRINYILAKNKIKIIYMEMT